MGLKHRGDSRETHNRMTYDTGASGGCARVVEVGGSVLVDRLRQAGRERDKAREDHARERERLHDEDLLEPGVEGTEVSECLLQPTNRQRSQRREVVK